MNKNRLTISSLFSQISVHSAMAALALGAFAYTATATAGDAGAVPVPIAPAHEEQSVYPFPNFSWTKHPEAWQEVGAPIGYEIQIAQTGSFETIFDQDSIPLARYVHDRPLAPGTYHWRVRAVPYQQSPTEWSKSQTFTITDVDEVVTVDVSGAPDHAAVIRAAAAEARRLSRQGRSVRLRFEPGEYRIDPSFEGALIDWRQAENIIVDGTGAHLFFSTRKQGIIHAEHSRNIVVMGFRGEFALGSMRVQGHVVGVDEPSHRITVSVEPGYSGFDASDSMGQDIFYLLEPGHRGRLRNNVPHFMRGSNFENNADGTWSFAIPENQVRHWNAGDRFGYNFRARSRVYVEFPHGRSVTAYDLSTTGWGEMLFSSKEGTLFNILHCESVFAEGRWMTGNADGVHVRGHEVGPWVEGLTIRAIGDDGIAFYARPATIQTARPNGQARAIVSPARFFNLEAGDEVAFFEPRHGAILFETKVESVAARNDGNYDVTFLDEVPENLITEGALIERTQIWNRSKSCGDFMVRNSRFHNIRRYGLVFRSKGGIVENNHFIGTSTRAIHFVNETPWPNGLYASEIIIRNNHIEDSNFDHAPRSAPVSFSFTGRGPGATTIGPRNILIEGNHFVDSPRPEISLNWTRNAVIRDNHAERESGQVLPAMVSHSDSENISVE